MIAGPVGSGKSVLADHFILAGDAEGDAGVIVMFDERPGQVVRRGWRFDSRMQRMADTGRLRFVHIRPTGLSPGEMLHEILQAVEGVGARRVVLDSLAGLEVALAQTFREEFRESLCHLVEALVNRGVTVMPTMEIVEAYDEFRISPHHPMSFAVDDIILQRYIEADGRLQKVLTVVKMRGSEHSTDLRSYRTTADGLVLGAVLRSYRGVLRGVLRGVPETGATKPD